MLLSPDVVSQYRQDGFAFLPQVIEPKWLDVIAKGFEHNMANPSPWAGEYQKSGGRFFTDNSNFSVNQPFQDLLYDSPIVDLMAELIGADEVWLYYDQVFYKDGEAVRTGWHQDLSYYLMDHTEQVTGAWISLDPLPAELALEVVRASHKGPLHNAVNPKKPSEVFFDVGGPPIPDIESRRDDYDIVSFAHKPGDMFVFHPNMLHGGAPMKTGQSRRTMTINIFGPEARYMPRPEGHAPTFPDLDKILKPGDPLHLAAEHGYFHKLRPVPAKRLGVLPQHDMPHGRAA